MNASLYRPLLDRQKLFYGGKVLKIRAYSLKTLFKTTYLLNIVKSKLFLLILCLFQKKCYTFVAVILDNIIVSKNYATQILILFLS